MWSITWQARAVGSWGPSLLQQGLSVLGSQTTRSVTVALRRIGRESQGWGGLWGPLMGPHECSFIFSNYSVCKITSCAIQKREKPKKVEPEQRCGSCTWSEFRFLPVLVLWGSPFTQSYLPEGIVKMLKYVKELNIFHCFFTKGIRY